MMDKLEKQLSRALTVVIIILTIVCVVLAVKIVQGREATLFGFRIYHILTGSMEPTIRTGSNVLVREVNPYTLEEGDIITFISKDAAIYGSANTHRIIEVVEDGNQRFFITQGDANNVADRIFVYPEDIKGKVVYYMKSAGFAMFVGFLHTTPGFVTVILLPLLFISWCFMRNFRDQVKELIKQNAEEELKEEFGEPEHREGTTE